MLEGQPIDSFPPHRFLVVDLNGVVEVVDFPQKILPTGVGVDIVTFLLLPRYLFPKDGYLVLVFFMVSEDLFLELGKVVLNLFATHFRYLLILK